MFYQTPLLFDFRINSSLRILIQRSSYFERIRKKKNNIRLTYKNNKRLNKIPIKKKKKKGSNNNDLFKNFEINAYNIEVYRLNFVNIIIISLKNVIIKDKTFFIIKYNKNKKLND